MTTARRDPGIRLSEKHGVNPCIPLCFYCREPKNEVALLGRLKGDKEAPRNAVLNYEPCDKCRDHMTKGVMILCMVDGKPEGYTGDLVVIKDEAIERIFADQPETCAAVLKARMFCIEPETWDKMGLPARGK